MNSMSKKYYNNCEKNSYEREEEKCPTIIKCGCPSTVSLPTLTITTNTSATNRTLASLTVDTSCICDPVIKIDFTSVYSTLVAIGIGAMNIQIYKQCKGDNVAVPVGPSWPVGGVPVSATVASTSFVSFSICDSDDCDNGCCTYTAVLTAPIGVALAGTFTNSTLSATVTCRSNQCQRKCKK